MKHIILIASSAFLLFSCTKNENVKCYKCTKLDSVIVYDNRTDSTISSSSTPVSSFDTCGVSEGDISMMEYYGSKSGSSVSLSKYVTKKSRTVLVCQ